MTKKVIIGIIVLILLGAGAYMFLRQSNSTTKTTNVTHTSDKPAAATITYSDSGYSPEVTMVKSGDSVEIKNDSSHTMQFDSDPHPIHTDNSELNVDTVKPGESMRFTVTTKGEFGYHDHLNPQDRGKIIVE